jgi:hypothetical protein
MSPGRSDPSIAQDLQDRCTRNGLMRSNGPGDVLFIVVCLVGLVRFATAAPISAGHRDNQRYRSIRTPDSSVHARLREFKAALRARLERHKARSQACR